MMSKYRSKDSGRVRLMYNRPLILSLVFLSVFFHGEIFAQFQLGQDIDGEASSDHSGASVSIN